MSTSATNGNVPGMMFRTMPAANATGAPRSTDRSASEGPFFGGFGFRGLPPARQSAPPARSETNPTTR